MEEKSLRKERIGVVVSDKMDKTIVVAAKYKERHPIYGKFVTKTKKYHAHDEKNDCHPGDTVRIQELRVASGRQCLLTDVCLATRRCQRICCAGSTRPSHVPPNEYILSTSTSDSSSRVLRFQSFILTL